MRHIALVFVLAACSSSQPTPASRLAIASNSATEFDATLHDGAAWARIVVRYTPTTTYYELTSTHGPLAFSGTEIAFSAGDPAIEASVRDILSDPRATNDGYVILAAGDPEYDLVESLLDQLIAAGAVESPTPAQKGTTLYAAAYTCARVLGMLQQTHAPGSGGKYGGRHALPTTWAYPGYDDIKLMPTELAPAGVTWNVSCCGPNNCTECEMYNWGFACGDWCAAGDHCNAHHGQGRNYPNGGGCGSIATWPGHCPHQDSGKISSYDGYPPPGQGNVNGPVNYCGWHTAYSY
jgi:hypothetical protein